MKKLLITFALFFILVETDGWAEKIPLWKGNGYGTVVREAFIQRDGFYLINFSGKAVNDSQVWVLIVCKLYVNGQLVHGVSENVTRQRHYYCPSFSIALEMKAGDHIEIAMRSDSCWYYPKKLVYLLDEPSRVHFSVVKLSRFDRNWLAGRNEVLGGYADANLRSLCCRG